MEVAECQSAEEARIVLGRDEELAVICVPTKTQNLHERQCLLSVLVTHRNPRRLVNVQRLEPPHCIGCQGAETVRQRRHLQEAQRQFLSEARSAVQAESRYLNEQQRLPEAAGF